MKYTIFFSAISFLALSTPSFAMEEEKEEVMRAQGVTLETVYSFCNYEVGSERYPKHPLYTRGKNFYIAETSKRNQNQDD